MNFPRVAAAAVAAWLLYMAMGYLVHGVLLADLYREYSAVMRPEADANAILPVNFGVVLIGFFAFAYAYAKGFEGGSGLQEGLRFGVLVAIMLCAFVTIWQYMVWPATPRLLTAWLIDYVVEFALYGMVVGVIYRPLPAPARRAAVTPAAGVAPR
jgi:hypothetical protein